MLHHLGSVIIKSLTSPLGHARSKGRVSQRLDDRLRDERGRFLVEQQGRVPDGPRNRRRCIRDNRQAGGHRLEKRGAEAFMIGEANEDVARRIRVGQLRIVD